MIYASEFKKWLSNLIEAHYRTPKSFINQTIKEFKSKLSQNSKKHKEFRQSHKITFAKHIEWIKRLMIKNKG